MVDDLFMYDFGPYKALARIWRNQSGVPGGIVAASAKVDATAYISKGSVVYPDAKIGRFCRIHAFARVGARSIVRDLCDFQKGARLAAEAVLGEGSRLCVDSFVGRGSKCGAGFFLGTGSRANGIFGSYVKIGIKTDIVDPVKCGNGVSISFQVKILGSCTIGDGVSISSHVKILGPCAIRDGATITKKVYVNNAAVPPMALIVRDSGPRDENDTSLDDANEVYDGDAE